VALPPQFAKNKMGMKGGKGKKPMPPGMKGKPVAKGKAMGSKGPPSTPLDSDTLGSMAQSLKGMGGMK